MISPLEGRETDLLDIEPASGPGNLLANDLIVGTGDLGRRGVLALESHDLGKGRSGQAEKHRGDDGTLHGATPSNELQT